MSLKMSTRESNGIVIIDLSGQITLGEASAALRDEVRDQSGHGFKKILLNLADVTYIDSAGLGSLITALHLANASGSSLRLASPNRQTLSLFQLTNLDTVFEIYPALQDALLVSHWQMA